MQCKNKKCLAELPAEAAFCHLCGRKQSAERKYHRRPNNTGSVYRLPGQRSKPWAAAKSGVYIGTYTTRAEAVDAVGKLAGVDLSDRFNLTFADVYEFWRAERCEGANGLTEKGKESYAVAYKHFAGLKDKKFRSLKTADYQKVVDEQIAAEKSRSSTEKDRQLISQLCKWAMREEIITVNYAQFLNLAKSEKVEKPTFNELEITKIEKAAPTSDAAKLVVMLLSTGMRIGELFSLPAIDAHDSYCIGGEKTEAGRNRVIPIRPEGRAYFQYFKRRSGDDRLLVEGYSGNQNARNFRNRDYYDLLKELGVEKKSPHCTRHTYASRAVKEGMPRELLQKILGHADYSLTADVYVHSDTETLVKAVEPVSNLLVVEKSTAR